MAKLPLARKHKRTQMIIMSFSELEIDVARQLLQLKRVYKAEQSQGYTTGVSSSTISEEIFGGEDDGYLNLKRRKKRFRSINHIYKATKPLLGFVNAKRIRLS